MSRLSLTLLLILTTGSLSAEPAQTWKFSNSGLNVLVVGKDAEIDDTRSYQIVVSHELRTITRLEVNRDGLVTDAWLTDMDGDGAFEIVVATGQLAGAEFGGVDVHEWHDFRFDSHKTAPLSVAQHPGYRGNDQFTVDNGRLRRSYPIFVDRDGVPVPTGKMAHFEYRYGENRWVPQS